MERQTRNNSSSFNPPHTHTPNASHFPSCWSSLVYSLKILPETWLSLEQSVVWWQIHTRGTMTPFNKTQQRELAGKVLGALLNIWGNTAKPINKQHGYSGLPGYKKHTHTRRNPRYHSCNRMVCLAETATHFAGSMWVLQVSCLWTRWGMASGLRKGALTEIGGWLAFLRLFSRHNLV